MKQPARPLPPQRVVLLAKMRDEQIKPAVAVRVANGDAHVRRRAAQAGVSHPARDRLLFESAVAPIDEKPIGQSIIGDENVRPAVAIEVRAHDLHRLARRGCETGRNGHVLKTRRRAGGPARAEVAIEPRERGMKSVRPAKLRLAARVRTLLRGIHIEIISDHEIEPAVAVVVKERRRHAPVGVGDARRRRHVGEFPLSLIQKQPDPVVFGDEDLGPSVVVDIASRHALAVARHLETRAGAHVAEMPVGLLLIKPVGRAVRRMGVVQEINIQPPVLIKIQERRARPNGFLNEKIPRRIRLMHKIHAGGKGHILEPVRVRARRRRWRFGRCWPGSASGAQHEHQPAQPRPAATPLNGILPRTHVGAYRATPLDEQAQS